MLLALPLLGIGGLCLLLRLLLRWRMSRRATLWVLAATLVALVAAASALIAGDGACWTCTGGAAARSLLLIAGLLAAVSVAVGRLTTSGGGDRGPRRR